MSGDGVEIILLKQLASGLRIPVSILNPNADLIFFNEPAEAIFGQRFEETGVLGADVWPDLIQPSHDSGDPLKPDERPLIQAVLQRIPVHRAMWASSARGGRYRIEVTALPLFGVGERFLGALSVFWAPGAGTAPRDAATGAAPRAKQHEVETILTRRIAARLAMPIFLVDPDGELLYWNPAAAVILGRSFEEGFRQDARLATRAELYRTFRPRDEHGRPLAPEEHPLSLARTRHEPVHRRSLIEGLDGRDRLVAITAIPLVGQSDRLTGAFGVFWEIDPT